MQAKHSIYTLTGMAVAAAAAMLGSCTDNPIAPDIDPGEDIPMVAFSVDRGNINEWSRAAEDPFKDWSSLKSIDNRLYPGDFIDKSVDGKPRDPQKADFNTDYANGKFNDFLNKDGFYHPGWNTDKPNPGDDHKDPVLSYSEIVDLLDESGMPAARMEVKQEPITEALLASFPRPGGERGESSRGVLVDQKNITERYRHIGVTGICYYNEKDENATDENNNKVAFDDLKSRITIMDNERVTFGGGDIWNTTTTTWFWNELGPDPEINYIRFFAYAPYDEMQDNDWISWYETATGTPSFHYIIPERVTDQVDLAAKAVDAPGDFYRSVPLQFEHLLTGVRFLVDDEYMAKKLQKITIRGVYGEGDYKFSTDPDDVSTPNDDNKLPELTHGKWTQTGDMVEFVLSRKNGDFLVKPVLDELDKDGDRWCITDADHTLLMLPQVLPEGAIVIFEFEDEEQPVLYGKLDFKEVTDGSTDGPQHTWKPGYIVTYFIQTFDIKYVLKLVKDGGKYPYSGGYDDFTVISYAVYYTKGNAESASKFVKIVPVPWEPVFYDRAGNAIKKPDWVNVTYDRPPRPDGEKDEYLPNSEYIKGDDPRLFEEKLALHGHVDVSALDVMAKDPHYAALRNAEEVGTAENPVDLSGGTAGSPRNTANCYIINGPGYYTFPLVYGNAYKDGGINTPAYTSTQGSFQTHNDKKIAEVGPWIKAAGKIKDAALISTNAINAVQLVNLTDDYLTIYVEPYFIDQGNTTLCVRDDQGNIMWSWHIWTTDYNPYIQSNLRTIHTERDNQTETFDFMTIDLGYHYPDAASGSAAERSVMWRPIQQCRHRGDVIIRTTANFYHILQEGTETTLGYAPYYNWGRKDPLLKSVHTAPDDNIFIYTYETSYFFATYSLRRLYDNTALTSYKWSLDRGHYYFWQPSPAESVLVPWAMPTFRMVGDKNGSTNNNYYNTWWKGTSENISNPGPVPAKDGETWPSSSAPHGYQSGVHPIQKYYNDLWCAGQGAEVNYLNAPTNPREVIKTVFDPCPPGFCVPPNRAFDRININYSLRRKHPEWSLEGYMQIRSDMSIGYTFYISPEAIDADDMSDAATINFPAAAWLSDRSYDNNGHWCLPWLSAYMNRNCSLWTADISQISAGGTLIGSIFNITDRFLPSQLAGAMDGTGGTAQNCTDEGARSTSFLSSSGGRHVRAVKEK